jgi:hypothetical protein
MRERLAARDDLHREPRRAHRREPVGEHTVAAAHDEPVEPARDPRERRGLEQLVVGTLRSACGEAVAVDPPRQQPPRRVELRPAELHHEPGVAGDEHEVAGAEARAFQVLVERPTHTRATRPRVADQVLQVDEVQAAAGCGEVDRR